MSNQHTKEPWLLNADAARQEPGFYGTPNTPGEEEVYTSIQIGDSARLTAFMKPADARLIIGASDLLEALRECVAALEGKPCTAQALVDARAAIAKTEGRS
jgi:hypothetical protein